LTERQKWDERYGAQDYVHGVKPSEFLRENTGLLPGSGLALDIAAGDGRNTVYLARLGYQVIAVDISIQALRKCLQLGRDRNVGVDAAVLDLAEFDIPESRFDLVICFNFLQRDLAPRIVRWLKSGGVLVFETLTTRHLRWKPDFDRRFLLEPGELLELFAGLRLLKFRERDLGGLAKPRSVASLICRRD
jgi:SAM-dependent methyltransferase